MLRVNYWFKLMYKKYNIFLEKHFAEVALKKKNRKHFFCSFFLP